MKHLDFELNQAARKRIANAFLQSRRNYYYARSKLACDPLYAGVAGALAGVKGPILDLGCGIGLLVHVLSETGLNAEYLGIDNDAEKIRQAEAAAHQAGLRQARFKCMDLSQANAIHDLKHCGSVVMLDLLQFVPPESQNPILQQAASSVSPRGRLIIRTGLADNNWRSRITRAMDSLSRTVQWMNTGPQRYPEKNTLENLLSDAGLVSRFSPLWGKTPFNNWLIQAERQPPPRRSAPAKHSGSRVHPAPPA